MSISQASVWKLAKSIIGSVVFGLGLHRHIIGDAAVVVAFHRVNDHEAMNYITCSTEMFQKYCHFFKRYFRVVPLNDIVTKLETGESFRGELAITFDDGYQDNYENAALILKKMGLQATFFIVTGFMSSQFMPPWDRGGEVSHPWMTWEHIVSLYRQGFKIGSHSRSHANLGEIRGKAAEDEIGGAKRDIQEKLGQSAELFAYPFGQRGFMLKENRDIVKAAGYRCCCSGYGGVNPQGSDPFNLQRIIINSWYLSPFHFAGDLIVQVLKLRYGAHPLRNLRAKFCKCLAADSD